MSYLNIILSGTAPNITGTAPNITLLLKLTKTAQITRVCQGAKSDSACFAVFAVSGITPESIIPV